MQGETEKTKFIASCSFGKDSLASIILAREHGEPLDEIVYCEVMFDEEISGEVPEHRNFIYNTAIPKLEAWGYTVTVLRDSKTYLQLFNQKQVRGKYTGQKRGFAWFGGCYVQRDLKLRPINKFWKNQDNQNAIQYVGIAADEPKRLERLKGTNRVSLLAKYGYTETMARELCKSYGLLSPIYEFTKRNGCWFCPNAGPSELRHLYQHHHELVEQLIAMEHTENLQPRGGDNSTGTERRRRFLSVISGRLHN